MFVDTAKSIQAGERLKTRLHSAVGVAIAAPSSHNTQPWKFRLKRDLVELFADRERALPVVDPDDRALVMSCGAALYYLRLAASCDGLSTMVRVLPEQQQPDLLARVIVNGPHEPTNEEKTLFAAIPERRTNRSAFAKQPVPKEIQSAWKEDVESFGCWLSLAETDDTKHAIANLVDLGDHLQASNPMFRRELAQWVHSNTSSRRDGIPGYAYGYGDILSHLGGFLVRTFDWGNGQAAQDRQLAEGSPLLTVLGTKVDTPQEWLACGQALAKILLRGTDFGLDASFLNQPVEVGSLRPQLGQVTGQTGFPQLVLRWGRGPKVRPTPRRPIEEVLV